jgi:dTDP-4-dehydrorhamnose 3,5-epimerase
MRALPTRIPDLRLIELSAFPDDRGFFQETYRAPSHAELGVADEFVQDNHSRSARGTLRGLHYQLLPGQAKLAAVLRGRVYDVAVDLRPESPSFCRWEAFELSDENHLQVYIPVGFAHGFCVLSETADMLYKVSSVYDPSNERTVRWDDPDLAIPWPVGSPGLSTRDANAQPLIEAIAELTQLRPWS